MCCVKGNSLSIDEESASCQPQEEIRERTDKNERRQGDRRSPMVREIMHQGKNPLVEPSKRNDEFVAVATNVDDFNG